ncbi:branched-chain amino acid ABC transporter permease [Acrocarpospora catenulata]|uniref:branched-chain amino acid ABC transporter permease n=1 Tax=Acrocarpospora catenulata TaxID=2836182 RepID=UPI001BD92841|nr:branched-chain amino acid ABC transporter permease [Acrocarpospora catenulata]
MTLVIQQLVNGLALGAVYALFGVGFALILTKMGILNVAHGTFATWGALVAYFAVADVGLPFPLALVVGVVAAGVIGVLTDLVAFEPLRRRNAGLFAPIIASIGMWILLLTVAQAVFGATATSFPDHAVPSGPIKFAGLVILPAQLLNIAAALLVAFGLHLALTRTRFGAAVRAISADPRSATIVGVNAARTLRLVAFTAAAIAGLAGVLAGLSSNNVSFDLGEALLLKGFAAVVVGGYGDIRGAALAGFMIGILEVVSAQYISSGFRDAITFGVLLVILVLRPQGMFGERKLARA